MRRGIGAQEIFGIAAGRSSHERLAVRLALEHGQAIVVRSDAAGEERIARPQQMLRRDRRADICRSRRHEIRGVSRGDVLHDHSQRGEVAPQRLELAFQKDLLTVEDVDSGVDHLTMHEQRQIADIGNAAHVSKHILHGADAEIRKPERVGGYSSP